MESEVGTLCCCTYDWLQGHILDRTALPMACSFAAGDFNVEESFPRPAYCAFYDAIRE